VLLTGDRHTHEFGRLAFHCARLLRVFARDILRLGTAMIELSSITVLPRGLTRRRQLPFRIAADVRSLLITPLREVARVGVTCFAHSSHTTALPVMTGVVVGQFSTVPARSIRIRFTS